MEIPADLPRIAFADEVYRVCRAGDDPLSTEGSRAAGRRYNPPQEFGALYCALRRETAIAEVARNLTRRGIALASIPAGEFQVYSMRVTLTRVLDLTDPDVQERLGVTSDALCGDDTSVTQQVAAQARAAGCQALLVPSVARKAHTNLVVFLDTLAEIPVLTSSESAVFGPTQR